MTEENLTRKQELESAIRDYLSHVETRPVSDSRELAQSDDHVVFFGFSTTNSEDDTEPHCFVTTQVAEQKLADKAGNLFNSQVGPATVRNAITAAIRDLAGFPSIDDKRSQQFGDILFEQLNSHYNSRYEAIVPMYQIECADGLEIPLANAILYSGGGRSSLARLVNNEAKSLYEEDKKRIENCSFLKFPVTGDSAIRLEQVEREAERALQVLRYIYPWFERDGKAYNPAHGVSMWKHSNRIIVYDRTPESKYSNPWNAEMPNGMYGLQRISAEFLRYAQEVRGLDDINYHIKNSDRNPVSKRICRALSFYDIASQTSIGQVAFSNFVISVDVLLPAKNVAAPVLTGYLGALIEHGKFYTGAMNLDAELADPESTTWQERVRLTTADFNDYYTTRGQILHGNEEERYKTKISKLQGKIVRQIAHNAIRAYAYLARAFNWQSDKEAKSWFKSPCKHSETKAP